MIHRREFRAMGSRMLALVDADAEPAILQELPDEFEAWEQSLSRFRSDSELCELNRRTGQNVAVSPVLWEVFGASVDAEALTGGLVNPLIADALAHAGYDRSFEEMLAAELLLAPNGDLPGVPILEDVAADPVSRTIRVPVGAHLDFGGVAKGWAAHQAMLALSTHGPALFSAGGDIAVSGPQANGDPWDISVEDPFKPGAYIEMLYLERGGVATSGKDYRNWMRAGVPQHHIIDPRTGLPAETDILTATVIAPTAMHAEALAKAVLISGSEAGLARLDGDESLAGLLVLENGQRLYSRNAGQYL
jgi:thiamine biosynthesis lipoprotein